ncbi:MAG: hypothetical protein ACLRFE_02745 [Clostridia bacterium]
MITDKQQALEEICKPEVNFDKFDKGLLSDKDVVIAYMQHHSSNNMLFMDFPVSINNSGMIDDVEFVGSVIKNLDIGYDKECLKSMLKYSTSRIIKNIISKGEGYAVDDLKIYAKDILTEYNDIVKVKNDELKQKQADIDEVERCIDSVALDIFDKPKKKLQRGNYKSCNIGFTAEIK